MNPTAPTSRPASLLAPLAAVVAAVVMLLVGVGPAAATAVTAPGPAAAHTRTGVGGHSLADPAFVEAPAGITAGQRRDNPVVAAVTTVGSRVAANTTGGSQRIYRAVEPDELADLVGSGQYRNIPGIGDGKYFFPTKQQADDFAEMMVKRNMGGPYCTTSGCIPSNLLRQVDKISPAGEGAAYYVPESMLPYIDDIIIHGG